MFDGKEGNKNSSIGFPWRDCFARILGRNDIPSTSDRSLLQSR